MSPAKAIPFDPDAFDLPIDHFEGTATNLVNHANRVVARVNALSRKAADDPPRGKANFGQTTFLAMHRDGVSVEVEVPFISETIIDE